MVIEIASDSHGAAISQPATPAPSILSASTSTERDGHSSSSFPAARIKKLMKLDPDASACSADAVAMMTAAAEQFLEHLATEASRTAARDKRKTILYRDVAKAVKLDDRLLFLSEVVPEPVPFEQALAAQQTSAFFRGASATADEVIREEPDDE